MSQTIVDIVRGDLDRLWWRRGQWMWLSPCHTKKRQVGPTWQHVCGSLHVTVLVNGRNTLEFLLISLPFL